MSIKIKNKYQKSTWEDYYKTERKIHIKPKTGWFSSYDIYLCDTIFNKYLSKYRSSTKNKPKICEIGCGDGKLLRKIADMFGFDPYGIEYSKEAIKSAEKLGIKIIRSNAFNKKIIKKYLNYFDIVFSYGFIEHILPPQDAVNIHLYLTKKNGLYIIQIPRFKGFNLLKVKFFRPDLIPLHNLNIMNQDVMKKICKTPYSKTIFCKNYGTFKFRLPMENKTAKYYALNAFCSFEYIFNPLLRLLFGKNGHETTLFSPAVMYIGKKINKTSKTAIS